MKKKQSTLASADTKEESALFSWPNKYNFIARNNKVFCCDFCYDNPVLKKKDTSAAIALKDDVKTPSLTNKKTNPKPAFLKRRDLKNPKNVSRMLVQRTQQVVNPVKFKNQSLAWLYKHGKPVCTHTLDNKDESPINTLQILNPKEIACGNDDGAVQILNPKEIACGNDDGAVYIWNLQTKQAFLAYTTSDKSAVTALASIKHYVIIGTESGKLVLLNLKTGTTTELQTYFGCINSILPVNCNQFVVGTDIKDLSALREQLKSLSIDSRHALESFYFGFNPLHLLALSAEAKQFFMKWHTYSLWVFDTEIPTQSLVNHDKAGDVLHSSWILHRVNDLSLAHNGKILAAGDHFADFLKFDSEGVLRPEGTKITLSTKYNCDVTYLELKPCQILGHCQLNDYAKGFDQLRIIHMINPDKSMIFESVTFIFENKLFNSQIALAPNGYLVCLYTPNPNSFEYKISIVDLAMRKLRTKLYYKRESDVVPIQTWTCSNEAAREITDLAIFPDGRIATGDDEGRICVWEFQPEDPTDQQPARAMTGSATAAAVSVAAAAMS